MKTYKDCTPGEALDAQIRGEKIEYNSFAGWSSCEDDWNWTMYKKRHYRIVIEIPEPALPKYAGWMWVESGIIVTLGFEPLDRMDQLAASGEIVPPSVWTNDRT